MHDLSDDYGILKGLTILVVLKHGVNVFYMKKSLGRAGASVITETTYDAEQAVVLAAKLKPDMVIMSLNFLRDTPEGEDGIAAAKRILADRQTCIVLTCAWMDDARLHPVIEAGVHGLFLLPTGGKDFLDYVSHAYESYPASLKERALGN